MKHSETECPGKFLVIKPLYNIIVKNSVAGMSTGFTDYFPTAIQLLDLHHVLDDSPSNNFVLNNLKMVMN